MIQKKVSMVGAFAVGKTSLVRRFVKNIYDDKYLSTVGVKIDRRVVDLESATVNCVVWDLAGEDPFETFKIEYVKGSSGCILVADPTRPATLLTAVDLRRRIREVSDGVDFVLALNKVDLIDEWRLEEEVLDQFREPFEPCPIMRTSAATGESVAEMFELLARSMVSK